MADHLASDCTWAYWHKLTEKLPNCGSEIKFTVDLFNYVFREYNVHWKLPEPPEDLYKIRFSSEYLFTKNIGDTIMFHLLYFRNVYKRLRGAMFPNGNWSVQPLEDLVARLFDEEEVPFFPRLLVVVTYTCHMCLYCGIEGKYCMVFQLLAVITKVIGVSLKDKFKAVGGWEAFHAFVDRAVRISVIAKAA